jgi:hypothetical protein
VKTVTGKTVTIDVQVSDTIEDVKLKIHDKTNIITTGKFFLTFEGHRLEDNRTLGDYNIIRDSTIWMVFF